ncbi:SCO family protein [Halorientalis salina]|uniref:SCO family protein n=1 Tax=Halorientalis salina TaxID=2932266 RepID=UPI0010AC262E|nr:SCO family protein [Halorientalis salina]
MDRRTYLQGLGAGAVAATAGCLGSSSGGDSGNTVLDAPEGLEYDPEKVGWPTHGDELPVVDAPDPIADQRISTEQFEGSRAVMTTFFYTRCPDGVCPALIQRLRQSQTVATNEGFADDVAFLPVTFDPEWDTGGVLTDYADEQGVDLDAGNWHFLRPETFDAAQSLADEQFGLPVEKLDPEEADHDHEGNETAGDGHHDDETNATSSDHGEPPDYTFAHFELIVIANEEGYVERGYPKLSMAPASQVVDDLETVVNG